jgi:hypothetical protein
MFGMLTALLAGLPAAVQAQSSSRDTVRVGDRVRVAISGDLRPIIATLAARPGDTLVLNTGAFTQRALGRSVNQIERSLGRSAAHAARHDALWGAAIGGGATPAAASSRPVSNSRRWAGRSAMP